MNNAYIALALGMGLVLIVFALAWYILQVVAYWKIFTKAGEAGWKSIIPVYNTYTQYKMTWSASMFWIWLLCTVAGIIFGGMDSFLSIVGSLGVLAAAIINVMASFKLAAAFGHGILFGLGIFFFGPIFYLILAFGSSEYQGPQL